MNENDQLLVEVKKIVVWVDMQKKVTKWSLIAMAVFIPAMLIFGIVMDHRVKKKIQQIGTTTTEPKTWYDADRLVRLGDVTQAIQVAETMILKMPQYPVGHEKLGHLYLMIGDVPKSREHFKEAFRLFPSEQNRKNLGAVMERSEKDKAPTNGSSLPAPSAGN